jgi:hypothetical protein
MLVDSTKIDLTLGRAFQKMLRTYDITNESTMDLISTGNILISTVLVKTAAFSTSDQIRVNF